MLKTTFSVQFKAALSNTGGITRLQGSRDSKIILLAPVPTAAELATNYCWCNGDAVTFYELLTATTRVKVEDLLIIPTTFDGKKPVKGNTELPKQILAKAAPYFEFFVCMGSDAFKTFIGHGKKPSMQALAGSVLYVPETRHKPLFTFPDPFGLSLTLTGTETWKERMIREEYTRKKLTAFESLLVKFNDAVRSIY